MPSLVGSEMCIRDSHPAEVTFPPLPQPKLVLEQATPEGCKAELVQLAGYIRRWYTRPKAVTHPSTNRARRALTSFTTPGRQHDHQISHHTKFVSLVYWHRHACLCICPASVRQSVRLSVPAWATAAKFAAVARKAGDIDRLLHGAQLQRGVRRANAGSATLLAYVVAATQTCKSIQ